LEETLLDTPDQRPSHAAFETFYTGLWGEAGKWNITMPPSVSRYMGQVMKEVMPKAILQK
jgi:hypothetical protein